MVAKVVCRALEDSFHEIKKVQSCWKHMNLYCVQETRQAVLLMESVASAHVPAASAW